MFVDGIRVPLSVCKKDTAVAIQLEDHRTWISQHVPTSRVIVRVAVPGCWFVGHEGLEIDAQAVADAIDVAEVRDDLDRIVDGRVAPAMSTQLVKIRLRDRPRLNRQSRTHVEQCSQGGIKFCFAIVVLDDVYQFG